MTRESLQELINALTEADEDKPEIFASLVSRSVKQLNVPEELLAAETGATVSTVRRWQNGSAYPCRFLRPHIYTWLKERAIAAMTVLVRPNNPPAGRLLDISVICSPSAELKTVE